VAALSPALVVLVGVVAEVTLTTEERRVVEIATRAIRAGAVQKGSEFVRLVWLVAQRKPEVVVEIGTGTGGSLIAWCEAASPIATIISIDKPGGEFGPRYDSSMIPTLQGYARLGQQLHLIEGDSQDPAIVEAVDRICNGRLIDFLFIDGDHSAAAVWADWSTYGMRMEVGGLVAFHDILIHPMNPGCRVHLAWEEIKQQYEVTEFCDPGDPISQWGGIGVVEV
jgi:cephalosporin hydroxylase